MSLACVKIGNKDWASGCRRKGVLMMHECPKCGFVQPKDKYCANCGLDIETYKPAPDSLFVRLSKNTALQITAVVLVVFFLAVAIFISQRDRIAEHLAAATGISRRPPPLEEPAAAASPITAPAKPDVASPAAMALKARPAAPASPTAEVKRVYRDLSISFFEISKPALTQLATEGQVLNETQATKSFLLHVPDAAAKIKEVDPDSRTHGEAHTEAFNVGNPINLDFTHMGGKKNPEAVGLGLLFTPSAANENLWDFTVEASINLKNESGGTLLTTNVNGSYSIPPKSALLLAGFLPHQKINKDDLWSFNGSPLMVYESQEFLNGLTEFVIVIQPK